MPAGLCFPGGSTTIQSYYMDLSGNCLVLFFRCTVCPNGSLHHPRQHKELALVFCSTFETHQWAISLDSEMLSCSTLSAHIL